MTVFTVLVQRTSGGQTFFGVENALIIFAHKKTAEQYVARINATHKRLYPNDWEFIPVHLFDSPVDETLPLELK